MIGSLCLCLTELIGRRKNNGGGNRETPGFGEDRRIKKKIGGNQHIGEKIDHIVQQCPVKIGQMNADAPPPCQSAIHAVNGDGNCHPAEGDNKGSPGARLQRQQTEESTRCCENVYQPGTRNVTNAAFRGHYPFPDTEIRFRQNILKKEGIRQKAPIP